MDIKNKPISGLSHTEFYFKSLFDLTFAIIGLLFLGWVIIIAWAVSSFETKSNGFFIQKRVGFRGKLFNIIKIKTMKNSNEIFGTVTTSEDPRITRSGLIFRALKIDELPQLWNILIGQMSFVGPRPDVPGYADKLIGNDRIILSVRPGITGPAQIAFKDEENILTKQSNPLRYNNEVIWPLKVKINKDYIENYSFVKDINYILKTITSRSGIS